MNDIMPFLAIVIMMALDLGVCCYANSKVEHKIDKLIDLIESIRKDYNERYDANHRCDS